MDKHDGKHIRFPDGQNESCNEIHVLKVGDTDNEFEVHAGFFKSDHKYHVEFQVPNSIHLEDGATWNVETMSEVAIQRVTPGDTEIGLSLHYLPNGKAGIAKEYLTVRSKNGEKELKVLFRAEILGRDQGTPMLKDGVKCIERPHSASSTSD